MISVDEIAVPESADDPDFRALVDVRNAHVAHALGTGALAFSPAELRAVFADTWRPRRRGYLPRGYPWGRPGSSGRPGRRSGRHHRAGVRPRSAGATVEVHPQWRGRGVGSALADQVEARLSATGRTVVDADIEHAPVAGPRHPSRDGAGSVPADEPGVRFLLRRGFVLEQVRRISALDVPARDVARIERAAAAHAGDNELRRWTTLTPDQWLDDLAELRAAMRTDEPHGERTVAGEPWDAERVRAHDASQVEAGRSVLVAAAIHRATGRVAGFTELSLPDDGRGTVFQDDTLVLKPHRGHRLGTWLKAANLRRLAEVAPDVTSVLTFNVESNRPMLDVNERLGFEPIGYEGVWQRDSA